MSAPLARERERERDGARAKRGRACIKHETTASVVTFHCIAPTPNHPQSPYHFNSVALARALQNVGDSLT